MIKYLPLLLLFSCGKPITESKKGPSVSELKMGILERDIFGIKMSLNFDYLPLEGEVKNKDFFWSGDSWRLIYGSINFRWNSPRKEGRFASPPAPRELKNFTEEQMKELAPSEKYDLLLGRYDYPLKHEVDRFIPNQPESWEGLCHGWAGATMNHKEPKPKTFINPDGLKISFGSSDIKALLTYYYAGVFVPDELQIGKRCEERGLLEEDFCTEDVTPVEFHAIITNKIGLRGDSIVIDIDRYREVWNHPITGFETTILSDRVTNSGRDLLVKTKMSYIDVVEKSFWEPTNGTYSQMFSTQELRYKLKLDHLGNMIHGEWVSRDRPDFIWVVNKVENFTGYLSDLKRLVNDR